MKHTYYFRDNKGNTMGVYELVPGDTLKAVEHTLYSTDRFGTYYRAAGTYAYELKDHLGNVRATIDRWTVDETAQQSPYPALSFMADYYPFGWMMPDRKQLTYRYGFNDQELDKETGWYTFKFRAYDARIARFHRVDPLTKKFPHWTPYQFAGNMPVSNSELEGAESQDETGSNSNLWQRFMADPVGTVKSLFRPDHPQSEMSTQSYDLMARSIVPAEKSEPRDVFYGAVGLKVKNGGAVGSIYVRGQTTDYFSSFTGGTHYSAGLTGSSKYSNGAFDSFKPGNFREFITPQTSASLFGEVGWYSTRTDLKVKYSGPVYISGVPIGFAYLSVGLNSNTGLSGLGVGFETLRLSITPGKMLWENKATPSVSTSVKLKGDELHGF